MTLVNSSCSLKFSHNISLCCFCFAWMPKAHNFSLVKEALQSLNYSRLLSPAIPDITQLFRIWAGSFCKSSAVPTWFKSYCSLKQRIGQDLDRTGLSWPSQGIWRLILLPGTRHLWKDSFSVNDASITRPDELAKVILWIAGKVSNGTRVPACCWWGFWGGGGCWVFLVWVWFFLSMFCIQLCAWSHPESPRGCLSGQNMPFLCPCSEPAGCELRSIYRICAKKPEDA